MLRVFDWNEEKKKEEERARLERKRPAFQRQESLMMQVGCGDSVEEKKAKPTIGKGQVRGKGKGKN